MGEIALAKRLERLLPGRRFLGLLALLTACSSGSGTGRDTDPGDASDVGSEVDVAADADLADTGDIVSGGLLPGDPSDDAIAAIPDLDPPAHPGDEWKEVGGFALSRTRLVVVVADGASVGEINAALEAAGAEVLGGSSVSGIVNATVPDDADGDNMSAAMLALEGAGGVLTAHPESSSESTGLAPAHDAGTFPRYPACDSDYRRWRWDDTTSASWGLQAARVPFVWNLRERLERLGTPPEVVAFERGWDTGHADLWMHDDTAAGLYAQGCQDHDEGEERNGCFAEIEHALTVGGVLSARHNDTGIEGVFPTTFDAPLQLVGLVRGGSQDENRRAVERALRDRDVRLINYSAGRFYTKNDPSVRPTDEVGFAIWKTTGQAQSRSEGIAWDRTIDGVADGRSDFIVTCSAGNDGVTSDYTFQASDTGGCQYAAAVLGNEHLLAVENLADPGDALHESSNRGGDVAAPGTCIGGVGVNGAYVADTGTSFASPFVTGALAVIWALDPELTFSQVRQALLDGASPGLGGSAVRVDLLGSVREVDRIRGNRELALELLDVDDRTVDGHLRAEPGGPARGLPVQLGDGCIDMANLRALRDAYILSRNPSAALDGGLNHPMRDLNGDGYVAATATTAIDGAADREDRFSRYDLNGDDRIDADDFGWLADHWGLCREGEEAVARTEGWTAEDVYRFDLEDESPTVPFLDSYDIWFEVPASEDLLVRVQGAPARWVDIDQHDTVYRDTDGDYWAVVTVPRSCSSGLPLACSMTRDDSGASSLLHCVRFERPIAGGDLVVDPDTGPPIPSGRMLFLSDGILWDGEDPRFASQGVGVYNGLDFQEPIEINEIDLGAHPRVTMTGDLALLPACLGDAIGQFEQCIWVVDLEEPGGDAEYPNAALNPPGESAVVEVIQMSEDGRTALVQDTHYSDSGRSWFLLDLDAATECSPFGSGACDPFGDAVTQVVTDVPVGQTAGVAIDGSGRFWFSDEDGRLRVQPVGSLVINETCVDAPSSVRLELDGETVLLARATDGPIAADGKVLITFHDGQWVLGYVDVDGAVHELGRGYGGRPDEAAAWGPGGRSVLWRNPAHHIIFSHIDNDGGHEPYWNLDQSGDLVDARVSWAPGWSYLAAWAPGLALGGDIGDIVVWDLADGEVAAAHNHDDRAGEPAWAPEGNRFAYGLLFEEDGRSDLDIWTVYLPTGAIDFLTNELQRAPCQGETECEYTSQKRPVWGRSLGRLR